MSSNVVNQVAFLRTSRNFPQESQPLSVEMNRSYVDIAEKMNVRTIGIYPTNKAAITGESWFLTSQKQQTLRQIFTFTTTTSITHGITFAKISPKSCGEFTDGTNWYGLPQSTNVAMAGQITFYVTPTQIVFLTGAGAPALTSGFIDLEWLSQV
jgi:hypothetical protein